MDFALGLLIFGWVFVLIWVPLVVYSQRKVHPEALFTLFFAELWERFSFYGMRAILILYMTKVLFDQMAQGEADARAYGIYGAYNALLYASPLIGGMLADRIMGFRHAVITGGIFMAAGQFALATTAGNSLGETPFFLGLALLTIGNGFFKPNISSFLGTFYDKNDTRKDSAFTIFYMGINIGAFLAPLTCGYLAQRVDWSLGFLAAGLGMVLGVIVFWRNMRKFGEKGMPPDPKDYRAPWKFGVSKQVLIILASLAVIPVFSMLLAVTVVDFQTRRIPDVLILTLLVCAVLQVLLLTEPGLLAAGLGLLICGGIFYVIATLRHGAIGMGDVKLAAAIGALLGFPVALEGLFLGIVFGGLTAAVLLLTKRVGRKDPIAYGPYLALGAWIVLVQVWGLWPF